ncbi:META domain-containing protein [Salinibacterium sp. NK8237]|uniref:META domain-containing protein n=1 Tax=Salinibacterium sp. NK8237 TaxID=2792038 RepID=UPI0018CF624D|nr:META domain-containing protein [Salinibacterium sp. NK8237]MBH0129576.1 META domain-containing protein [Salinibacterium sp. NK8237]
MPTKSVLAKVTPLLAAGLLALTACAGPATPVGSDEPPIGSGPGLGEEQTPGDSMPVDGIGGTWIYIDGTDGAGDLATTAEVTIMITDDEIMGAGACNSYSAALTGEPQSFAVSDLISTERACTDNELMGFDERYFAALAVTTAAIPTGGSLVLQGDGVNLNFMPSSSLPLG